MSDHLITQNLNITAGAATLRATYQDIGQHFTGFQAMKQANAGDKNVMAQIGALEKETGIKRLGFGAGLKMRTGGSVGLDWDTIQDGQGSIEKHSLTFDTTRMHLRYGEQLVGEAFAGIPEAARRRGGPVGEGEGNSSLGHEPWVRAG